MIEKMRKLTFLVYHKEYDRFLRDLQTLGVMHIQKSGDQTLAEPETLRTLRRQKADVTQVLAQLQPLSGAFLDEVPAGNAGVGESIETSQAMKLVRRAQEIQTTLTALSPRILSLENDAKVLRPWGTVDRALLE